MMKRWTMVAAMLAAAWAGLPSVADAQDKCEPKIGRPPLVRKGTMIAAINPTVAPIQYIDDDGNIIGLDVDLGNAIAKRLCLTMQFQSTQFATMIPILKEGRIDLINSFMFYTPERAAPGADGALRRRPRGHRRAEEEHRRDQRPRVFLGQGVRHRARHRRLRRKPRRRARSWSRPASRRSTCAPSAPMPTCCRRSRPDQVAGAFIGIEQAVYYQKKGADFFRIAVSGLEPHAEALAFKDPALAEAVAKVMNEMKADGSFDKIFEPYGHCVLPGPYKVTSGPLPPFTCPDRKD